MAVAALKRHDQRLGDLQRQRCGCTGKVFVTFNDTAAARACLDAPASDERRVLRGRRLLLRVPPEPKQVLWENLGVQWRERWARQFLSSFILLVIIILGSSLIVTTQIAKPYLELVLHCENVTMDGTDLGQGLGLGDTPFDAAGSEAAGSGDIAGDCALFDASEVAGEEACTPNFWQGLTGLFGSTALMIIGHVFIFILTPIFANTLEVHKYHASKELYVFLKLTFFQCFNVILNAGAYTWLFRSGVRAWLGDVSALITNVLVCETFVINLGIDLFRPDVLIRRLLLAPRAKTQYAMNSLYEIDADVQIAFRMQLAAKVIILAFCFSSANPVLLLIVCLYCNSAHLVDKFQFLRRLKPPPRASSLRIMYAVVCWMMPMALIARLAFGAYIYYALECCRPVENPNWEFATGLANTARPVVVVVSGSAALALPLLYFLYREAVYLQQVGTKDRIIKRPAGGGPLGRCRDACVEQGRLSSKLNTGVGEGLTTLLEPVGEAPPALTKRASNVIGRIRASTCRPSAPTRLSSEHGAHSAAPAAAPPAPARLASRGPPDDRRSPDGRRLVQLPETADFYVPPLTASLLSLALGSPHAASNPRATDATWRKRRERLKRARTERRYLISSASFHGSMKFGGGASSRRTGNSISAARSSCLARARTFAASAAVPEGRPSEEGTSGKSAKEALATSQEM